MGADGDESKQLPGRQVGLPTCVGPRDFQVLPASYLISSGFTMTRGRAVLITPFTRLVLAIHHNRCVLQTATRAGTAPHGRRCPVTTVILLTPILNPSASVWEENGNIFLTCVSFFRPAIENCHYFHNYAMMPERPYLKCSGTRGNR